MVLTFKISNINTDPPGEQFGKKELDFYDFISVNADFEFYIEGQLSFKQVYWNVGELALQLTRWKTNGLSVDFHYNCIDAEEKGLFSFQKVEEGFLFSSEWAESDVNTICDRKLIEAFVDSYSKAVKEEIKNKLGHDVSQYLQKDITGRIVPLVTIDPELDKLQDQNLFPEKLAKANEMLKTAKLPFKKRALE